MKTIEMIYRVTCKYCRQAFVPCFCIDGKIVMEGVPAQDKIEAVFKQAIEEEKREVPL